MATYGEFRVSNRLTPMQWRGMTKDNHLRHYNELFSSNAQNASNKIVRLFSCMHGHPNMETILNDAGVVEFENDDDIKWKVIGASDRNIPLVEARDEDGVVVTAAHDHYIGANVAPFELVFAEDWFADGDWIVGDLNEVYPFRVIGEPRQEGTNYVYRVELGGAVTQGVPPERLLRGERFSIEADFVEKERSRKVGDVRFTSPLAMRNDWTTIRKQATVSGKQVLDKIAVELPVVCRNKSTGKCEERRITRWMDYVDFEFERQFAEDKNRAVVWGRSNRNENGEYLNIGKSGEVIRVGAGLMEQREFGHTEFYNDTSTVLKCIENALETICANGNLPLADQVFEVHTGRYGASAFSKAVMNMVSGWHPFQFNGDQLGVVSKTSSPIHKNALKAGYQFTEYIAPNNLHIKLVVDPMYDDPVRNKIRHPEGGLAMSYRFDIFDMGNSGERNIVKCKIAGEFGNPSRGYQAGPRNPFTRSNSNNYMSWDADEARIHKMETFGVVVYDPTRTYSLIPSILVA